MRSLSRGGGGYDARKDHLVAGRPAVWVRNVSQPTMTVYSPQGKNTGAAVVVSWRGLSNSGHRS